MKNGAIIITEAGVSASVRKTIQFKKGRKYSAYIVDYYLLGKRQQLWRSTLEEAQKAARRACLMISKGEQPVLQLKNDDRLTYLRAVEALGGLGIPLDTACRDFAEAARLLGNVATLTNASHHPRQQSAEKRYKTSGGRTSPPSKRTNPRTASR